MRSRDGLTNNSALGNGVTIQAINFNLFLSYGVEYSDTILTFIVVDCFFLLIMLLCWRRLRRMSDWSVCDIMDKCCHSTNHSSLERSAEEEEISWHLLIILLSSSTIIPVNYFSNEQCNNYVVFFFCKASSPTTRYALRNSMYLFNHPKYWIP